MLMLPVLHALYKGGSSSSLTVSRMVFLVVASTEDKMYSTLVASSLAIAVIKILGRSEIEKGREFHFRMTNVGVLICSI